MLENGLLFEKICYAKRKNKKDASRDSKRERKRKRIKRTGERNRKKE
jgi:hypothetical protein